MARAKKTETKKTTTKKATKKVVDDFPVDDMINDLKGSLITENSEQIGYKKKPRAKTKPKPIETVVEENAIEEESNDNSNVEVIEDFKEESNDNNNEEIITESANEETELEPLKENDKPEEIVSEQIQNETDKEPKRNILKTRQIVTNHKWMGQIIDF